MKTKRRILWVLTMLMAVIANGCIGDLDQYPHIEKTSKDIYTSVHNYRQVLAKLYGSYVLSGQDKGGGNKDIEGTRAEETRTSKAHGVLTTCAATSTCRK